MLSTCDPPGRRSRTTSQRQATIIPTYTAAGIPHTERNTFMPSLCQRRYDDQVAPKLTSKVSTMSVSQKEREGLEVRVIVGVSTKKVQQKRQPSFASPLRRGSRAKRAR